MSTEQIVQEVAWLLVAASIVGVIARRLQIPYLISLVVLGLLLGLTGWFPSPQLDPPLMLFALLPPLLFDAAFRLNPQELRAVGWPILILAGPGVVLTAVAVGVVVHVVLGVSRASGLLLGSVVGTTDPVAVTWGGLRGGLTVALALALPPGLPDRTLIEGVAFGVVIVTILVQGLTLPYLIRAVRLHGRPREEAQPAGR